MSLTLFSQPFDPWAELQAYQQSHQEMHGKFGATAVFVGTMRDFNDDNSVQRLTLEHYPGMTEKQIQKAIDQAREKWSLIDTLVIHRIGDITPNQPIVLVAAWSIHRGDAFDACRQIMENLKSNAPFWKKELTSSDQERWVQTNTSGYLQKT